MEKIGVSKLAKPMQGASFSSQPPYENFASAS